MSDGQAAEQPQQGVNMSPGMNVGNPGAIAFACRKVPNGFLLHFEHFTGATFLPVNRDMLKQIVDAINVELEGAGPVDPSSRLIVPNVVPPRDVMRRADGSN